MGAYVSLQECKVHYNVDLNCTFFVQPSNSPDNSTQYQGDVFKGEYGGDPDIAGVGIFGTFMGVTGFALMLSLIIVILSMKKHRVFPFRRVTHGCMLLGKSKPGPDHRRKKESIKPGPSEILQGMVLSCSDAQIFTGAAYALTLRYFRGCIITAYHYNVVSNLMLLSCATHLMAITVVRNYWELPGLRYCSAELDNRFPSFVSKKGDTVAPHFFLAAACFQSNGTALKDSLRKSFGDGSKQAFLFSSLGSHIEGWNKFLIILLWYTAALVMEIAMFIRRGGRRDGWRMKLVTWFKAFIVRVGKPSVERVYGEKGHNPRASGTPQPLTPDDRTTTIPGETPDDRVIRRLKILGHYVLTLYYLGGIAICTWTVIMSGRFIQGLREWVQRSGWLKKDDTGKNPEDDATSFGQLVPIFTSALVLFTLLELISAATTKRRDAHELKRLRERVDQEQPYHVEEQPPNHERPPNGGVSPQIEESPQLDEKIEATMDVVPVIPSPSTHPTSTQPSTNEITPVPTSPDKPSLVSYTPSRLGPDAIELSSLSAVIPQPTTSNQPSPQLISPESSFFPIHSELGNTEQTKPQPTGLQPTAQPTAQTNTQPNTSQQLPTMPSDQAIHPQSPPQQKQEK